MGKAKAIGKVASWIGRKLTKARSPAVGPRGGSALPAQTSTADAKKSAADAVAKKAAADARRQLAKGGTIKPKPNAFKGVQSAGAARNSPKRAARGNRILAGTAAGLGAAVVYNKNKSSTNAAASPAAVAPKKKPTNVVMPRKAKPVKAAPKKAAPKKAAPKKAAPKKTAPKAKAKPRAASFTPTNKKTPLSVSKGKKKVGYVKSNRSLRGGSRTRGR